MTGYFGALRQRHSPPLSPFTCPVPETVRDDLALLQAERLHAFLPLLCLMIAATAIAMAIVVMGDLPWWQQLAPPLIIVGSCLAVLLRSQMRGAPDTAEGAFRQLHNAMFVTAGLGLVAGLWSVNAFTETEKYYCMVAPVFIGIGALVTATCLLSVPRAAIGGMMLTVTPIAFKMALYDNLGVRVMAVMMVIITIMQSGVVLSKFRETVAMLTLQHKLNQVAETDFLTGLDNRMAFLGKLNARLEAQETVLVALADLDGFKAINDTHGHLAGDAILVEVAQRMRRMAVSADSVARLGGDEFACLFVQRDNSDQARCELDAVRNLVGLPIAFGGQLLRVGTSIGVADSRDEGTDGMALLARADQRLYEDKARNNAKPRLTETFA